MSWDLYLDKYYGVWKLHSTDDPFETCVWEIVTANSNHRGALLRGEFLIGHSYNNASVEELRPFVKINTGQAFEFPPVFEQDEPVYVNYEWLRTKGADAAQGYVDFVDSIGEQVQGFMNDAHGFPDEYIVEVHFMIPKENVTKQN